MLKIALLGFDFQSGNKGCEALSYSFVNMLTDLQLPPFEIHLFGYSSLGEFPRHYPHIPFFCHIHKFKSLTYCHRLKKQFDAMDCIFDITYGDGFSDIYGTRWNIITNLIKQIAVSSRAPFVLLPQTYGPYFNPLLRRWSYHIIRNADLAFARDEASCRELAKHVGRKVNETTDLAFALPWNSNQYTANGSVTKVGINVSSLLWDGAYKGTITLSVDYRQYIEQLIQAILAKPRNEVHLIAHVIDQQHLEKPENDLRVIKQLKEKYPSVIEAPAFATPMEAKSYISQMDVFTGARMHATIGAFSSGVPTIPFSYSKKFEGLYGNLDFPFVISATKIDTNSALSQTLEYIERRNELGKRQSEIMAKVNEKLDRFKQSILNVLEK